MFVLSSCYELRRGNVGNYVILDGEASEVYSEEDIELAIEETVSYFKRYFGGCTLKEIGYAGDEYADEFEAWAEQYDADEAIVLISSFDVDFSGGNGSLEPNSTYKNWKWILVRSNGGNWKHKTHGYG